jgi:ribosomal protein S12 methylthiotransferase
VETVRRRLPDAVIRSTFLLGFPGEDDGDFAALLDFQEKARLDWLGCFTWSREEGTAAYAMEGRVPKKTAVERKKIIEERQVSISAQRMDRLAGRQFDVLIEESIECGPENETVNDSETIWLGRLYCHAPEVDGAAVITGVEAAGVKPRPGDLLPGRIIARRGFDLEVRISRK